MRNTQFITGAILGVLCGLLVAYFLFNRYAPLQANGGIAGRLDKLTGKGCVFVQSGGYITPTRIKSTWGMPPCN